MIKYHQPVLLTEVIQNLKILPDHWYIDCNLGGGGHTEAILEQGGKVIGIDLDAESINEVAKKHDLTIQTSDNHLEAFSNKLVLYQANFANLPEILTNLKSNYQLIQPISGVLFDLGVSSYQLETSRRGFSFNVDSPLDMRMDQTATQPTAADLINVLHEKELADLFWKLGEEKFARPIARKIVKYRQHKLIQTTNELSNIILSVHHHSSKDKIHPATRVFQALRIAVNDELNSLKEALPTAFEILNPGGRICVISFHSLEDRIVKNYFKGLIDQKRAIQITKKPLTSTEEEIFQNPRSRSAKLRVIEKN